MQSDELLAALKRLKQDFLVAHLAELPADKRARLEAQLQTLDFKALELSLDSTKKVEGQKQEHFEPVKTYTLSVGGEKEKQIGEKLIREGKIALFTVAGGQGSRLGYEGPKGCFGVTPVIKKPLFQVFAEKLLVAQRRYGVTIPWVLMTSTLNNRPTEDFFAAHTYFGLKKEQVYFFMQGEMPAVDAKTGAFLLEGKESLSLAPDGTGGAFKGLYNSGAIAWLKARGVELLSYIQVDNPLARPVDPVFMGAHQLSGSEFSSKAVSKRTPDERVGVFARKNGSLTIVEYSELPIELAQTRDSAGGLVYAAGNTAMHILSLSFIEKTAKEASLTYHAALKKIPYWSKEGGAVNPTTPNAIKFEQFVFDALGLAKNPMVLNVAREEEFSPVKNATGVDSSETCCVDQLKQWAKWLQAARVELPFDKQGVPMVNFEISPLFADSAEELKRRKEERKVPERITEGLCL